MKKIKVIVKEKNILELMEDASIGDIIDLEELLEVDFSYIENIIEQGKDKVYESKLNEVRTLLSNEKQLSINELKQQIELLKKDNQLLLQKKEQELIDEYTKKISELNQQITVLNETKVSEINNRITQEENKYLSTIKDLENQINTLKNEKINEIKQLKTESQLNTDKRVNEEKEKNQQLLHEIELLKKQNELTLQQALNKQANELNELLSSKEEEITILKRQKSLMNIKQTGEDLEAWCENEVTSYMQNGLFNCVWLKDNKVVKDEGETKGSKADFIFKIFATENHLDNELLASICLEMKDELPDSTNRKTNSFYYAKLEENRKKKNCNYSILVSNLELDKPNILPIYKVREYENMYVVRPAYLMVFLNMIASLTTRFVNLVITGEKETLELHKKQELIEEFNRIKNIYLDRPFLALSKEIESIRSKSESIKSAALSIDAHCDTITNSYLKIIEDKINRFEINLNRNIIKNLDE